MTALLQLAGVWKAYPTPQGSLAVLKGVDLSLGAGETLALMGESGSGKSTLLHLVAGLDDPDRGEVLLDGIDVPKLSDGARARLRRETLGLVFQQFNLIPALTVADNMAFQAKVAGKFDPAWGRELVGRLGLTGLGSRYPEQLSGGQQQRVAIGRVLAARPRLILADEPTGNLDEATADEVLDLVLGLVRSSGASFLMATHSERMAARLERRLRLKAGVLLETGAGIS